MRALDEGFSVKKVITKLLQGWVEGRVILSESIATPQSLARRTPL
jgi:hypothetical protein